MRLACLPVCLVLFWRFPVWPEEGKHFGHTLREPLALHSYPIPPSHKSTRGLLVKTNDMHFVIYLSALVRAIVALHDVVQNKIQYKDHVCITVFHTVSFVCV